MVVLDVDDGDNAEMTVSLSVPTGSLTFSSTTGLSFTTGDGAADASMSFTGTKAVINAAFATLSYQPVANAYGTVAMTYAITDSGAGGSNGAQTGNFTRDIVIIPVDDAPTITIGSIALSADTGTISSDFITKTASQTI
ncbi:hypothetical protein, partial [Simplicispira psychrophila]|uniref:hypothetical protein n=1 Tax=Simplicispira psychrophila TaxID=80882 RepID=UPI001B805E2F